MGFNSALKGNLFDTESNRLDLRGRLNSPHKVTLTGHARSSYGLG